MDRLVFAGVRGRPLIKTAWVYYWHPIRSAFVAKFPADHWLRRRIRENSEDHLAFYELRHPGCTVSRARRVGGRRCCPARPPLTELVYKLYGHPSKALGRERLKLLDAQMTDDDLRRVAAGEA